MGFTPPIIYTKYKGFNNLEENKKAEILKAFFRSSLDKEYKLPILKKEKIKIKLKIKKTRYLQEFKIKSSILIKEARQNKGCGVCESKLFLQVHHKDKNTFNNDDNNLIVLCFYCHTNKHNHMKNKKPPLWLK